MGKEKVNQAEILLSRNKSPFLYSGEENLNYSLIIDGKLEINGGMRGEKPDFSGYAMWFSDIMKGEGISNYQIINGKTIIYTSKEGVQSFEKVPVSSISENNIEEFKTTLESKLKEK